MSVAVKLSSPVKPARDPARGILGPGGNRVRSPAEAKRRIEAPRKKKETPPADVPPSAVKSNSSVDSSCSSSDGSSTSRGSFSSSFSSSSSAKAEGSRRVSKRNGTETVTVGEKEEAPRELEGPARRCDWITPNSDPLYTSFHDEEWGVPVHDDKMLFELLVFSMALAELSWPAILRARDKFRKLFDNFDPSSVAQFTDKKLVSLKVNGNAVLSEPKLRAIVENAKQILKLQQEFGSFSNYCWRFVNHNPLRNGFRYGRQVPAKTPKAELISKDLMQRGFRCVGPTVVYSFMQASGIVNDHLVKCFRHQECNLNTPRINGLKIEVISINTVEEGQLSWD